MSDLKTPLRLTGSSGSLQRQLRSPGALYWLRERENFKFQYRALNSVIDLTVLLYLVIPGLLLAARLYYGLWVEPLPMLLKLMPLGTLMSLWLLLTTLRGLTMRVEAADILFLRSRASWMKGIKRRGIWLSIGYSALLTAAGALLLAPLFVRSLQIEPLAIMLFAADLFVFRIVHMLLLHFCRIKWHGWRSVLLQSFCHLLIFGLLQGVAAGSRHNLWIAAGIGVGMAFVAFVLIQLRMQIKGTFYADVEEEIKQKLRLSALLLSQSTDKPKRNRSKPWLLRRSNRLLPRLHGHRILLAELVVKNILRNWTILRLLLVYTGAGMISLQFPPNAIKLVVLAGLIVLLAYWLNGARILFMENKVMDLLPVNEPVMFHSAIPAMRLLLLVPVTLFSISYGWAVWHDWKGLLGGLAGGLLLSWWAGSWLWSIFGGFRKKNTLRLHHKSAGE